jgi:aminocarboxymuconate-semialdehyde decarboxylase
MGKYCLPWLVGMPAETSLAISSLAFSGVFDRWPRLRWCFAHGGGSFVATVGRIEQGFLARPEVCAVDGGKNPRDYLGRFYVDSLVHSGEALRTLLAMIGDQRIALGSDYPFPLGEARPGELIESVTGLTQKTQAQLLAGNALDFLGLDRKMFGARNSSLQERRQRQPGYGQQG